jgi:hypothetical protein
MPLKRIVVVALLALAVLAPVARADSEPNDALAQAEGPLASGHFNGHLAPSDSDWYVFYIQGQQQLHLDVSAPADTDDDCVRATLLDTDGRELSSDYTTAPGTNRYFVVVNNNCSSDAFDYTVTITPGSALVNGPAMPTPTPTGEPNESSAQAAGPLAGGVTYSGSIDTDNDEDWFFFYTTPGTHQLDLVATNPALDSCDFFDGANVTLYRDGSSESLGSTSPDSNTIGHVRVTVTGADRFLVQVTGGGCLGAHWQFRVDPPEAVSTNAPTPEVTQVFDPSTSTACIKARARVHRYLVKQRTVKRQLRHAHGRRARTLRHKLRTVRRHLRQAVQSRRLNCQTL